MQFELQSIWQKSFRSLAIGLLAAGALSLAPGWTTSASAQDVGAQGDPAEEGGPVIYDQTVYPDIPQTRECRCKDVLVGDCTYDIGDEPDVTCGALWNSPYIWVRNQPDGFTNHTNQSPIAGQTNWVYIALHNRGYQTLNSGVINVYFAKASTGLYWPASWIGNVQSNPCTSNVTYGDWIGAETIVSLNPNQDAIARIEWNTVPDPADFCNNDAHHFCMLARFISPEDPMTYIEGTGIVYNTQYNNNIAWKNQMILDRRKPSAPLDIHNGTPTEHRQRIVIKVPDEEREDGILKHGTVEVTLDPELAQEWEANGGQGTGIENQGEGKLRITANDAEIAGITLRGGATATITVDARLNDPDKEDAGREFHFDIAQFDDDAAGEEGEAVRHLVGGENITVRVDEAGGRNIRLNQNAAGAPTNNAYAQALQLTVHPNPTRGMTTIDYILPADTRVTVSIYDINGTLVRTLVTGADQAAGSHTIEWDGTNAESKAVASGTYFYRIDTPRGTAQQQLGVAR